MTSSLLRRSLFAVAVALSTTACGDKPTPMTELASEPAPHRVAPVPVPEPHPVAVSEAKPEVTPTDYADAMELGKQAAVAGDVARARAMFDAASRIEGKRVEPQLELARLFLAGGDNNLAMSSAKKAVKLAPASSAAWNTLGRAHRARYAYDAAITAFETALDKNPKNAYAWNNLGLTMLDLELWREAKNALEEATALPEAAGYMWNNLGISYEHLDLLDEARVAFETGAAKGSDAARASRARLEGVETIARVDVKVKITDVELVPDVVEETGQVDEAAIVEEAARAEAIEESDIELEDASADVHID